MTPLSRRAALAGLLATPILPGQAAMNAGFLSCARIAQAADRGTLAETRVGGRTMNRDLQRPPTTTKTREEHEPLSHKNDTEF